MNATQALNIVRAALGPAAKIYEDRTAPDGDTRRAQATHRHELRKARESAQQAMVARRNALLNTDTEYLQLRNAYTAARDAENRAPYGVRYRYSIGDETCGIRTISAQGDTLVEAVHMLQLRTKVTA